MNISKIKMVLPFVFLLVAYSAIAKSAKDDSLDCNLINESNEMTDLKMGTEEINSNLIVCKPTISGPVTICKGTGTQISVSLPGGTITGKWYNGSTEISSATFVNVSPATTTTYKYIPSAPACVVGLTDLVVVVTVVQGPVMTSSNTYTIGTGEYLIQLLTSDNPNATFQTVVTDNPNVSGEPTTVQTGQYLGGYELYNSTSTVQSVLYTVTPTAGGCAGTPQVITVNITPCNPIPLDFTYRSYCSNNLSVVRFTATLPAGYPLTYANYNWTFGDGKSESMERYWEIDHPYAADGTYTVTVTYSDPKHSCPGPDPSVTKVITVAQPVINHSLTTNKTTLNLGESLDLTYSASNPNDINEHYEYTLDLGDNKPVKRFFSGGTYHWTPTTAGVYHVVLISCASVMPTFSPETTITPVPCCYRDEITIIVNDDPCPGCVEVSCADCVPSFAPIPGEEYILSAWVQQAASETAVTYESPNITLNFEGVSTPHMIPYTAKGDIIDGWQRIEEKFKVPAGATGININLNNGSTTQPVYFDDIRIHPKNASFKSFVYDPISMRLMAELDENNYATFYEYDEEGALIRVKKETERGVKTIKEAGNSTVKKNP